GASERPRARLVHARDAFHARAPQHALEVEHRIEPLALRALALVALLQRFVDLPHALAGVALELRQRLRRDGAIGARIALANLLDRELRQARRQRAFPRTVWRSRPAGGELAHRAR